ncbi:MAG: hypothetical protein E7388_00395 [Ruminococcaceae bacterium]|nr:hypothetical protein [Oscillospiraceae bacterium]
MKKAKNKLLFIALAMVLCLCALTGCDMAKEEDGPKVTPDTNSYISMAVTDRLSSVDFPETPSGDNIFEPAFIMYANGDIDGWYTCSGSITGETWIVYNHFERETNQWSDYKCVLQTSAGALDSYAVSQPSVIKYGDYYYMAYTGSSLNEEGAESSCTGGFIARSENPDGPYEKWNGADWGGIAVPFVYFNGPVNQPGASSLSLVEIDDTVYVYYTWDSADTEGNIVSQIRLAKANIKDENWPGKINQYGNVCYGKGDISGLDVKYSEATGKMIAVGVDNSDTDESRIVCFEGNTPEKLIRIAVSEGEIHKKINSVGVSGSVNGHIRAESDYEPFLMYAYDKGYQWSSIEFCLSDRTGSSNQPVYITEESDVSDEEIDENASIMALKADIGFQNYIISDNREVMLSVMDQNGTIRPLTEGEKQRLTFSEHNEDIIDFDGNICIPKNSGLTTVKVTLDGVSTYYTAAVYNDPNTNKENPAYLKCYESVVVQSLSEESAVQLCAFTESNGGTFREHYTDLTFSDYDNEIINISESGILKPISEGKTEVTLTHRDRSVIITVIITP